MSLEQLIEHINQLQPEKKRLLIHRLLDDILAGSRTKVKKSDSRTWRDFKGIAKGVWEEDAQEYVNALRNEDRF